MPQVDLESLVSACAGGSSDRKVACETIAGDDDTADWPPPESIWLSGEAEFDWLDRNAVVYERKESTKGSSVFATSNPGSNNNSQRFSKNLMKSKAAIIGLPKSQKSAFADASQSRRIHHNRQGNARLFPKRSASVGKSDSAVVVYEPSSPKVSCIGRVRSNRNRRLRTRQRSISSSTAAAAATSTVTIARQKSCRSGRRKTGFFESLRAIFRSGRRGKPVQKPDPSSEDSSTKKKKNKRSNSRKSRGDGSNKAIQNDESFNESVSIEPPGLGSLNRFASGRRSESWSVVSDSEIHVAQ
ncbi:uncharacterized protein LOC107626386 [Arachis ipaensis]|uniref:uncharacterized protein LOC107626386 n=1 Tax=Arachis ipaensis TaxID=130454 RepID=UPI0007AFCE99|nr:uncharacterized protein LOC107626386 [Arachis ipaensis]